jgi:hypothetical protein
LLVRYAEERRWLASLFSAQAEERVRKVAARRGATVVIFQQEQDEVDDSTDIVCHHRVVRGIFAVPRFAIRR